MKNSIKGKFNTKEVIAAEKLNKLKGGEIDYNSAKSNTSTAVFYDGCNACTCIEKL